MFKFKRANKNTWAGIAQSIQRLATGWTVREPNPGGARFSAPVQTGPGALPTSYTKGTGSFTVVKRPGRDVDQPPHLAPRLKKEFTLITNLMHFFNVFISLLYMFRATQCSSSGESNCINTSSGIYHSVQVAVWYAGQRCTANKI